MAAYYNEIDPDAIAVLRQLIADDVIAPGDVDTRSIKEVQADDLRGYAQCHFFAGSCPCQPFSAAGKGAGVDDPRHLWPDFHRLIRAARPAVVMGEQVAGAPGYGWLDGVRADLAAEGYASRATDIPACSVEAPHQRNRLYWIAVGDAQGGSGQGARQPEAYHAETRSGRYRGSDGCDSHVGNGFVSRLEGYAGHGDGSWRPEQDRSASAPDGAGAASPLGHDPSRSSRQRGSSDGRQSPGRRSDVRRDGGEVADYVRHRNGAASRHYDREETATFGFDWNSSGPSVRAVEHHGRNGSAWADAEWIVCHDGKARRAKPGLRLLVDGLPGRVGLWRVGGNAISPVLAAEVIGAYLDAEADLSFPVASRLDARSIPSHGEGR